MCECATNSSIEPPTDRIVWTRHEEMLEKFEGFCTQREFEMIFPGTTRKVIVQTFYELPQRETITLAEIRRVYSRP